MFLIMLMLIQILISNEQGNCSKDIWKKLILKNNRFMISVETKDVIPNALNYKQQSRFIRLCWAIRNQENHLFMDLSSHLFFGKDSIYSVSESLRDHNKGPSSQGYGFSSGHVWVWELDCEEGWVPKNWCFWTVMLEKTLESPLDCKEIQPVHSEGD